MKTDLVKLANHLDQIGHRDLADKLDSILSGMKVKTAQSAHTLSAGTQVAVDTITGDLGAFGERKLIDILPEVSELKDPHLRDIVGPEAYFNPKGGWLSGMKQTGTVSSQWTELKSRSSTAIIEAIESAAAEWNKAQDTGNEMIASGEDPADDGVVTASDKLDGIFSVNPVGKVSR